MENEKKILIYIEESEIATVGGPPGYIFNLRKGLKEIGVENIEYLKNKKTLKGSMKKSKLSKSRYLGRIIGILGRFFVYSKMLYGTKHDSKTDLKKYDVVHFHNVKDLFEARDSLKNFNGIIILTSHSPKPFSKEIFDELLTDFERKYLGWFYKKIVKMEEFSFSNCDYIIFPCKESEEPYINNWKDFEKYADRKKIKYLLTGTKKSVAKVSKVSIRKKYNIPESAFVVSYVGRHNETKGYDKLLEIGNLLLSKNEDIFFLVAGKEEPLLGLKSPRWIEVGWTDDPHSLINAADVFVLPNKETYFDLVMIEVISLGKVVIASDTGGNKFFKQNDECSVLLYNSVEEAINLIIELKMESKSKLNVMEKKNIEYYENYLNEKVFAEQYIGLINSLDRKSAGKIDS